MWQLNLSTKPFKSLNNKEYQQKTTSTIKLSQTNRGKTKNLSSIKVSQTMFTLGIGMVQLGREKDLMAFFTLTVRAMGENIWGLVAVSGNQICKSGRISN